MALFIFENEWPHIILLISTPSILLQILWYYFSLEITISNLHICKNFIINSFFTQASWRRIKKRTCVASGNVNPWYWWTSVRNNILEGLVKWKIFGKTDHRVKKKPTETKRKGRGQTGIAEEAKGFKLWVNRLLKFM